MKYFLSNMFRNSLLLLGLATAKANTCTVSITNAYSALDTATSLTNLYDNDYTTVQSNWGTYDSADGIILEFSESDVIGVAIILDPNDPTDNTYQSGNAEIWSDEASYWQYLDNKGKKDYDATESYEFDGKKAQIYMSRNGYQKITKLRMKSMYPLSGLKIAEIKVLTRGECLCMDLFAANCATYNTKGNCPKINYAYQTCQDLCEYQYDIHRPYKMDECGCAKHYEETTDFTATGRCVNYAVPNLQKCTDWSGAEAHCEAQNKVVSEFNNGYCDSDTCTSDNSGLCCLFKAQCQNGFYWYNSGMGDVDKDCLETQIYLKDNECDGASCTAADRSNCCFDIPAGSHETDCFTKYPEGDINRNLCHCLNYHEFDCYRDEQKCQGYSWWRDAENAGMSWADCSQPPFQSGNSCEKQALWKKALDVTYSSAMCDDNIEVTLPGKCSSLSAENCPADKPFINPSKISLPNYFCSNAECNQYDLATCCQGSYLCYSYSNDVGLCPAGTTLQGEKKCVHQECLEYDQSTCCAPDLGSLKCLDPLAEKCYFGGGNENGYGHCNPWKNDKSSCKTACGANSECKGDKNADDSNCNDIKTSCDCLEAIVDAENIAYSNTRCNLNKAGASDAAARCSSVSDGSICDANEEYNPAAALYPCASASGCTAADKLLCCKPKQRAQCWSVKDGSICGDLTFDVAKQNSMCAGITCTSADKDTCCSSGDSPAQPSPAPAQPSPAPAQPSPAPAEPSPAPAEEGSKDSCDGIKCHAENTESCSNNACICKSGFGGLACDKDITSAGVQKMLQNARKVSLPTRENLLARQNTIKDFARDNMKHKIKQGKSVKEAIAESKVAISASDLPMRAQIFVYLMGKPPVVAVAPQNKDTQDTCDQGADTAGCGMVDLSENQNELTILSTDPEPGSWSVLTSGGQVVSKQTRVSEFVYEMQCWDNGWGAKQTLDVTSGAQLYGCNGNVLMIASQSAVCTPGICNNGNCTIDGDSYTCSCEAGWTGEHCDQVAANSQCYEFDCSNYGGHKTLEHCGDSCTASVCCQHATKEAFDAVCDGLTTGADYVENKCCHRNTCI